MNSHKIKTLIFALNYWFLTNKKTQSTHFCNAVLINKYFIENIIKTAENFIRQIEGQIPRGSIWNHFTFDFSGKNYKEYQILWSYVDK